MIRDEGDKPLELEELEEQACGIHIRIRVLLQVKFNLCRL